MKLEKKEYANRAEKRKDFAIGVGLFLGFNVLLLLISSVVLGLAAVPMSGLDEETGSIIILVLTCLTYVVPILANLGLLIYFTLTRTWIALGMLGTFAFLVLLGMVAGVIFSIICFSALSSGV